MIERILVGLDGSALAERVLPFAELLARGLGAEVTLLHVTALPHLPTGAPLAGLREVARANTGRAERYLAERRAALEAAGIRAHSVVGEGAAPVEIVGYAERERMDCIALATHGRSGLARWVHGSVADRVLHATRTPLMLVGPDASGAAAPPSLTRIVVPLDGSDAAESALPMAEALAGCFSVPLVLLHVVELAGLDFVSEDDTLAILAGLEEHTRAYLARVAAERGGVGRRIEPLVLVGSPADAIIGYAANQPGAMTVMTTHARRGLPALVLGSVARRTVQHVSGPVLLLRPP
jgi:nucleotide-binding universal stress UspA family protein